MTFFICIFLFSFSSLFSQEISKSFEFRYVSSDSKANGVTDFKGPTAVFDTDQRISYLRHWAEYGKRFFNDPELDTKVAKDEEVQSALDKLKPRPLPEVRTEIPISGWKYLGYREGQREEESNRIAEWESMKGAEVRDGVLVLENTRISYPFEPQTRRAHFEWRARIPDSGDSCAFSLSEAVRLGFDGNGLYYIVSGEKKQGSKYEPGSWHRFKVELDLASEEGRYNLFVDDEKVADFVPLSKGDGSSLVETFRVESEGELMLDDVLVKSFGQEYDRDYTYPITTLIDQDFEIPPYPYSFAKPGYDDSRWRRVPYRRYAHGGERNGGESLYLRKFVKPGNFERAVLNVETVRPSGVLYVNGKRIRELTRYPEQVDVTDVLRPNQKNLIAVRVDPHDVGRPIHHIGAGTAIGPGRHAGTGTNPPLSPRGSSSSPGGSSYGQRHHMSSDTYSSWFAGLMYLELTESVFVDDIFAYTTDVGDPANLRVNVKADAKEKSPFNGEIVIRATPWYPHESQQPAGESSTSISINGKTKKTVDVSVPGPKLWTTEDPNLYKVQVLIKDQDGRPIDDKVITTGLRTVSQEGGTFRINGEPTMLNGPLIFGHRSPIERIAQWMFSPPREKWIEDIIATRKMNGNAFRMSVHDKRFSGAHDRRLARIADQLGMMLIWQTPTWMRSGHAMESLDFDGLQKYAGSVRNHPSIVMWQPGNHPYDYLPEWYGRILKTLVEVDPSRLVSPAASLGHMDIKEWPDDNSNRIPGWTHPQLARGNMEQTTGYGKDWSVIREFGAGRQDSYLNSNSHAWFDYESEESIAQPNWSLHRGQPYYCVYSYEKDYDNGSIGRVLSFDEWEESQAWQALTVYEAYRKKRWLGFDGTNWCPLRGGGNTATYKKPVVDYQGYAKLAYHAMRMVYQPILAGSKNVDIVYGPKDKIPVMILNIGDAKTVDVKVIAKNRQGKIVDSKHYENVSLAEGRSETKLPDWQPNLKPDQFYGFEYTVKPDNK